MCTNTEYPYPKEQKEGTFAVPCRAMPLMYIRHAWKATNCVQILEHHLFWLSVWIVTHLDRMAKCYAVCRPSSVAIVLLALLRCQSACAMFELYAQCTRDIFAARKFDYKLWIMRNWAAVNTIFKSKLKCVRFFLPFTRSHAHCSLRWSSNFGFVSLIASIVMRSVIQRSHILSTCNINTFTCASFDLLCVVSAKLLLQFMVVVRLAVLSIFNLKTQINKTTWLHT